MTVSILNFPQPEPKDETVLLLSLHRIVHVLADRLIAAAGPDSDLTQSLLQELKADAAALRNSVRTPQGMALANLSVAAELEELVRCLEWVNDARRNLANLEAGRVEPPADD